MWFVILFFCLGVFFPHSGEAAISAQMLEGSCGLEMCEGVAPEDKERLQAACEQLVRYIWGCYQRGGSADPFSVCYDLCGSITGRNGYGYMLHGTSDLWRFCADQGVLEFFCMLPPAKGLFYASSDLNCEPDFCSLLIGTAERCFRKIELVCALAKNEKDLDSPIIKRAVRSLVICLSWCLQNKADRSLRQKQFYLAEKSIRLASAFLWPINAKYIGLERIDEMRAVSIVRWWSSWVLDVLRDPSVLNEGVRDWGSFMDLCLRSLNRSAAEEEKDLLIQASEKLLKPYVLEGVFPISGLKKFDVMRGGSSLPVGSDERRNKIRYLLWSEGIDVWGASNFFLARHLSIGTEGPQIRGALLSWLIQRACAKDGEMLDEAEVACLLGIPSFCRRGGKVDESEEDVGNLSDKAFWLSSLIRESAIEACISLIVQTVRQQDPSEQAAFLDKIASAVTKGFQSWGGDESLMYGAMRGLSLYQKDGEQSCEEVAQYLQNLVARGRWQDLIAQLRKWLMKKKDQMFYEKNTDLLSNPIERLVGGGLANIPKGFGPVQGLKEDDQAGYGSLASGNFDLFEGGGLNSFDSLQIKGPIYQMPLLDVGTVLIYRL